MRNYVGLSAKGFKFDNKYYCNFVDSMTRHIGEVGTITHQKDMIVHIHFKSGGSWNYPIEEIDKHLIINKPMTLTEVKDLYAHFYDDRTRVENAIRSIERGYVCLEEIIDDDYFNSDGYLYSSEDYVIDRNGNVLDRQDAFYCEGLEEYVDYDDTVTVYENRDELRFSRIWAERNCDYIYYEGDYYDDDALDRHGIVWVSDTQEYAHQDNVYWCEDDDCYYSEEREEFVRGYHNGSYQSITFNNKSKYKIGYEIEKEDETVRNSIRVSDFERETNGYWRKERDGSLCDDSGYELISPTFEFDVDKIFKHIEDNEQLVAHINASHSYSCGGHIHLSEKDLNGDELFNKIKGYTPLFYALYYGRVNKSYCKGKKNEDLRNENEKYQAIKIHHDRVEFRIISAVPNVETLKWRTKLLMMILQNPTDDIIKAYYNVDTKFTKLLKQVYSDEKLTEVKERFIKFTREFEQLEIKNNN
jgi:hypothetical protein